MMDVVNSIKSVVTQYKYTNAESILSSIPKIERSIPFIYGYRNNNKIWTLNNHRQDMQAEYEAEY